MVVGCRATTPSAATRARGDTGPVTTHCKNFNTGSIGISVAAMGNAVESPFDPGAWPITKIQFLALVRRLRRTVRRLQPSR